MVARKPEWSRSANVRRMFPPSEMRDEIGSECRAPAEVMVAAVRAIWAQEAFWERAGHRDESDWIPRECP